MLTKIYGKTLFEKPKEEERQYHRCEKVYVGKIPFACQSGDLIMINAEVSEKYCTENVFVKDETSVYCEYNGIRDDRERIAPLFKHGNFSDINR